MRRPPSCRRLALSGVLLALVGAPLPVSAQTAAEAIEVRFELNDAQVKGRQLPGVGVRVSRVGGGGEVASGETGPDGRFATHLAPGTYQVAYRLDGYVPYTSEATELNADGQLVTVSLSRMLEATEAAGRDVRIVLNWGSRKDQVRDADSHLACACGAADRHVFYKSRQHVSGGHKVELDVDDTDWGGPETITLTNPVKGSYLYWVHDYSGPPAVLGTSELVVRVLIGSEQAGELKVYRGLTRRAWRPFKAIEVAADGRPALVRWTEDEIAEGQDLEIPAELRTPDPVQGSEAASLVCPGDARRDRALDLGGPAPRAPRVLTTSAARPRPAARPSARRGSRSAGTPPCGTSPGPGTAASRSPRPGSGRPSRSSSRT